MRRGEKGFGYLLLIFALAIIGLTLAGFGQSWKLNAQRERETELLAIGRQFSAALESYRRHTPAGQPDAPASLEELLEDTRFPFPVRHLRRLYRDPMTGQASWHVDMQEGRIVAIHSHSLQEALRQPATLPAWIVISPRPEGLRYQDWMFVRSQSSGMRSAAK